MKRIRIISAMVIAGAVFATSGVSWAQDNVIQEADQVVYRKKQVIDFSDVTIEGELTKPEGSYILNRKKAKFNILIRVRETFLPEMLRSVDHL